MPTKTLIRKTQLSSDVSDLIGQYGSGFFIPNNGTQSFVANSVLFSGVNVNFDNNTNVKFSGTVNFTNDRIWETGLIQGSTNYLITYSGGSFPRIPKVFTSLETTGTTTVYNYNITGRTADKFHILFNTALVQNATLMVRATL
jgi:hypothetical protein